MKANMLSLHTPLTPGVESKGHIVLASSVRASVLRSVHTFCPYGTISQYLLVRFDSFLFEDVSSSFYDLLQNGP